MTQGYNSYDIYSEEYQGLGQMFPQLKGLLEFMGMATYGTPFDVNQYLNVLRYNRQDRPFVQADQRLIGGMLHQFRASSFPQTQTNWGLFGTAIDQYGFDNKLLAELSLRKAAVVSGAGSYAFGTGGSMADLYNNWDSSERGNASDALVGLFSSVWNSPKDPNVTKGTRSMLLAGLMQADPYLLREYQNASKEKGVEYGDSLDKFGDVAKKVTKYLEGFGEAANTWSRVLKTDAEDAMKRLENLFGGAAYGIFQSNPTALAELGYNVKHVGGVTGRGADQTWAMVQQAGYLLNQIGGHSDGAINAGTQAMLLSTGVAGYRTTQEEADKLALRMTTVNQNSEQAALYFGGYAEYYRKFGGGRDQAAVQAEYDERVQASGLTLNALNRMLGENYNPGDFYAFAERGIARDFQAGPNNFSLRAAEGLSESIRNRIENRLLKTGRIDEGGTVEGMRRRYGIDIQWYTSANEETRKSIIDEARRNGYIKNQEDIDYINRVAAQWEDVTNVMSKNNMLDVVSGYSSQAILRTTSTTNQRNNEARQKQVAFRTAISSATSGAGIVKSIVDFFKDNPNGTIGEVLSVLSGESLSGEAMNIAMRAEGTAEDRSNLQTLLEKISSRDDIREIDNSGNLVRESEEKRTKESKRDIQAYQSLANRMLTKIAKGTFTEEDRKFFNRALGVDYYKDDKGKGHLKTIIPKGEEDSYLGYMREALDEEKERLSSQTELEKNRQDIIVGRLTEGKIGTNAQKARIDAARLLAMSKLADEQILNGDPNSGITALAKEYQQAIDDGDIDRANSKFQEIMQTKDSFGTKFAEANEEMLNTLGISKNEGIASALAMALGDIFDKFRGPGKDSLNVNITGQHP